ncbi:hypothetical protein BH10BAC5_BH10BAC5_23630 [soil metagenome]
MKKYFYLLILTAFVFAGCTKMEDKKTTTPQNTSTNELPPNHPPIDGNKDNTQQKSTDSQTQSGKDDKVPVVKKDAEDSDAKYEKDKSDANKKNAIDKNLTAGNYLMFEADIPPKEKYRPALKYYRRVLALDPKNQEAAANKDKIEEIYTQMGLPIPQ